VKLPETIEICKGWFAYLDRQKARSIEVQKLASMARAGQQEEAQRRLRQLDLMSVTVYDGGRLEPAVRELLDTIARLEAELAAAKDRIAAYDASMIAVREKGALDKVMEALGDKGTYKIFNQGWDGCIAWIDAAMKEPT
jgi:hypothetical protein